MAYIKGSVVSPTKSEETNLSEEIESVLNQTINKKSGDSDFRQKYKTEICKFWGYNKECRYGDNVFLLLIKLFLVCICSWKCRYEK